MILRYRKSSKLVNLAYKYCIYLVTVLRPEESKNKKKYAA